MGEQEMAHARGTLPGMRIGCSPPGKTGGRFPSLRNFARAGTSLSNSCGKANGVLKERNRMDKLAILALLDAKAGKERDLEEFLKSALPLAEQETGTATWYAVKLGPGRFGIFDTFKNEDGRNAHLTGAIAKALFAKADELLAKPPQIEMLEILAVKAPAA
jgi:quinol monooxygenase YgiN